MVKDAEQQAAEIKRLQTKLMIQEKQLKKLEETEENLRMMREKLREAEDELFQANEQVHLLKTQSNV